MATTSTSFGRQYDGMVKHKAHLAEQRRMYNGTKHGTAKSKRGERIRVNPEVSKA